MLANCSPEKVAPGFRRDVGAGGEILSRFRTKALSSISLYVNPANEANMAHSSTVAALRKLAR